MLDWARTGLPVKSLGFGEDGQAKAKPSCAEREARVKMKVNSVPYFKLAAAIMALIAPNTSTVYWLDCTSYVPPML